MSGLCAVVMAAGSSRRMGANKLLLKIDDIEIFRFLLKSIPCEKFEKVVVVYADDAVGDICKDYDVSSIKIDSGQEKCATIRQGAEACEGAEGIMFFVADQPFLKSGTISKLANEFRKDCEKIIIPRCKGRQRNPVVFPKSTFEGLLNITGDFGGRDIIRQNESLVSFIEFEDEDQFADIDTREDYERLLR